MRFHFMFSSSVEPQQSCNQMSLKVFVTASHMDKYIYTHTVGWKEAFSAILVKFVSSLIFKSSKYFCSIIEMAFRIHIDR